VNLLLYARPEDDEGKRLQVAVHEALPLHPLQVFRSIIALQQQLRSFVIPESIAILSANNQSELRQMQILRPLLTEIFVVLIIPDSRKRTIRLAHLLLPRFMTSQKEGFVNLQEVLKKMVCTPH
jgi:hypothetical protein